MNKGCGCNIGCASCGDEGVDNLCNPIVVYCSSCAKKIVKDVRGEKDE